MLSFHLPDMVESDFLIDHTREAEPPGFINALHLFVLERQLFLEIGNGFTGNRRDCQGAEDEEGQINSKISRQANYL